MIDMFEEVIIDEHSPNYDEMDYFVDEEERQTVKKVEVKLPKGIIVRKCREQIAKPKPVIPGKNGKSVGIKVNEPPIPARKVPIVRKPGEIVTPVHLRPREPVKVSPSVKPASELIMKAEFEATRVGVESPTAKSSSKQLSTRRSQPEPDPEVNGQYDLEHSNDDGIDEVSQDLNVSANVVGPSTEQLNRIEKKMDLILGKMNQIMSKLTSHDGSLKLLKKRVNDLRSESVRDTQSPPPKRRKNLVTFPVTDDNYLLRLEELSSTDDEIQREIVTLYNDAPDSGIYEYMRKNTYALFQNTSKYTWTGRLPSLPPTNAACKLHLIELLISCGCDKFPNSSRDHIEKEFRRALHNFNETRSATRKRRLDRSKLMSQIEIL
ncbi:uncharacterized protein LOC129777805 [Toxorhynchites rutilus septentrionalis]|uniref:uncharacterized protein LOC129777805 n=1 Tax=Toxorhynchites rutilus septentrionalis TaxID=329112 RepID=UPI00247A87CD|nr:uncharacterized protein LOC129777805 [Toxorhynchites rutilus septentrionalis]